MGKNNKMAHGFTQINTDNGIKYQCLASDKNICRWKETLKKFLSCILAVDSFRVGKSNNMKEALKVLNKKKYRKKPFQG